MNVYGTRRAKWGGDIPIWLGKPVPKAIGGTLAAAYVKQGAFYPAGTPLNETKRVLTPFLIYEVVSVADSKYTLLAPGYAPKVGDVLQTIDNINGFAGRADAITVTKVTKGADNKSVIEGTLAVSGEGQEAVTASIVAGNILIEKSDLVPNGYLGHDIDFGEVDVEEGAAASGDIVVMHRDGLLIDRTPGAPIKALMKAAVPDVVLVDEDIDS